MNLKDLIAKMTAIEEGQEIAPTKDDKPSDAEGMISIGGPIPDMMGMGHQEQPKQQDSVSMNVSLNGAGAGGVRDLMNILHNIEGGVKGSDNDGEEPILGAAHDAMSHDDNFDEVIDDEQESWGNSASGSSGHHTHGVDAVTFSGDDMNSKGKISPVARAPGTNALREPSQYDESLVNRLSAMYQEIKEAKEQEFDALKHVKNPTKGEKEAAKDVKRGSYADRAAMLKSAEADGRLKKESYNPNSVAAQHARDLEKSRVDDLKKKAEAGDEKAKAALKRHEDKKAGMRADFDARMER